MNIEYRHYNGQAESKTRYILSRKNYGCNSWKECAVVSNFDGTWDRMLSLFKSDKKIEAIKITKATTYYEDIEGYTRMEEQK